MYPTLALRRALASNRSALCLVSRIINTICVDVKWFLNFPLSLARFPVALLFGRVVALSALVQPLQCFVSDKRSMLFARGGVYV